VIEGLCKIPHEGKISVRFLDDHVHCRIFDFSRLYTTVPLSYACVPNGTVVSVYVHEGALE